MRRRPTLIPLGLFATTLAAVFPPPASAQRLPTVQDVVDYIDDLWRSTSSHAQMTMTVVRKRGTRSLTLESWSRGDEEALFVIRAPAREAGAATLRTDEGLWNYAPRADRLIRIPSGLLSESWMGSHFTNDDLLRETSYMDDHEASLAWTRVDGEQLLEVTLTPVSNAPVVYTRLVFQLEPSYLTPRRADYWDEDELIRSMILDRVQVISGKHIPMRMILQPADEPNERTEVVYDVLELDVPVAAELFTRRGLRRVARN